MKSTTFALGSLLASAAIAQPHNHKHQHQHQKRHETVVWETETAYETEVVHVTTTIWVPEGYVAPTTSTPESTPSVLAAQFYEPAEKPAPTTAKAAPAPAPSSSTFSSVYVAPAPASSPAVAPIVAAESTPEKVPEVKAAPVTTSSPEVVAQAVAPTTSKSSSSSSSSSTASSPPPSSGGGSGASISGSTTGTIFSFEEDSISQPMFAVSGSCGLSTYQPGIYDDNTKMVAWPVKVMNQYGASQHNKLCGKTAHLTSRGKTIDVMIADTCNTEGDGSIDMTPSVWEFFGQKNFDGSHQDFMIEWTIDL